MEQNNKTLTTGQDQTQMRLTQVFNYYNKLNKSLSFTNILFFKKTKHATLAKSFIDTMTNYLRMQKENEKKYKERIVRQFRIGVCVNKYLYV